MRLLITIAVVSLALCCHARPADDDYAYEDDAPAEPAPSPAPKPTARHALVNSRTGRGPSPLIGSRGVKTTTTPAPPKPAEPEVVNEPEAVDEEAGADIEEAPAVTTEAPKKGLSRGGVRPFRSNQDLLAALKRKRQQEHSSGAVSTHPTTSTPASSDSKSTAKASSRNNSSGGGRRSYSRPSKTAPAAASDSEEETEPAKKPSFGTPSRRFSGARGKSAQPAPVNEDPEGDEEEPAPRAAKSYRGGRRI